MSSAERSKLLRAAASKAEKDYESGGALRGEAAASHKMKASQVRELPHAERAKYMRDHAAHAAREYREHPELLIDGGSELLNY